MDTQDLANRISALESRLKEHRHNGIDFPRVRSLEVEGLASSFTSAASATMANDFTATAGGIREPAFDTETYDIDEEFNTSTYKFVANDAGTYLVTGVLDVLAVSGDQLKPILAYVYKNTSVIFSSSLFAPSSSNLRYYHSFATTSVLGAGDSLQIKCDVSLLASNATIKKDNSRFTVTRIA